MKYLYLLLIPCLLSSCEFFDIKRYPSDLLLKEEVEAMNWEEVDTYPVFKDCAGMQEADSLACFTESLHSKLRNSVVRYIRSHRVDSLTRIDLYIEVSKEKRLSFSIDSLLSTSQSDTQLSYLKAYLQEGLDSIQVIEPALKRGVPVTTVFTLPILFSQENQ